MKLWEMDDPHDQFVSALLRSRGQDDAVLDKRIRQTLFAMRFWRSVAPFVSWARTTALLLKTTWEFTYGRHRKPSPQVHSGSNQAPGFSSGASGFAGPVAISTGYSVTVPAFEDAGIRAGEITAYRCWHLHSDGLLHSAIMSDFAWAPGLVVEGDPSKPAQGVYGFKDKEYARSYGGYGGRLIVTGTVHLWGDVCEHERGYRASRAMVASIDDGDGYDAKALRKKYRLNRKLRRKAPEA